MTQLADPPRARSPTRSRDARRPRVLERRRLRLASRPPPPTRSVTEVAAGSGLLVPTLFDHYRPSGPGPAAFFGLPVVRRPSPRVATVHGGGFVASGAAGKDRLPTPWAPPGLHLTGLEGAGEVQTPLTGPGAARLRDRRHGVVPPRQVRRARSSTPPPCTCVSGDAVVATGPDLPRAAAGRSDVTGSTPPAECWTSPADRRRRSGRAGWCASTARPGRARPPSRPRSPQLAPDAGRGAHGRPVRRVGRPAPASPTSSTRLLRPLAAGPPGLLPPLGLARRAVRRHRRGGARPTAGARGGRAPAAGRWPTWSPCWCGSTPRTTCGCGAGWTATVRRSRRTGRPGPRPRRPTSPPRARASARTSGSTGPPPLPCPRPAGSTGSPTGRYDAVVTETGATLRSLTHDGRRLVDGFAEGELPTWCRGQLLAPWPNRVRDGRWSLRRPRPPAGAQRAGAGQRDPRAGPLVHVVGRRRGSGVGDAAPPAGGAEGLSVAARPGRHLRAGRRRPDRHPGRHQPARQPPRRTPRGRTPTSASGTASSTGCRCGCPPAPARCSTTG